MEKGGDATLAIRAHQDMMTSRHTLQLACIAVLMASGCNPLVNVDDLERQALEERGGECVDSGDGPAICDGCGPCEAGPRSTASACVKGECVYACDGGFSDTNGDLALGARGDGCDCEGDCGPAAFCGDGDCGGDESQEACCADCGCSPGQSCDVGRNQCFEEGVRCGDDRCEEGEASLCCQDCGCEGTQVCAPSGSCVTPACGDGACDPGETPQRCCSDCGCPSPQHVCDGEENVCEMGRWSFVQLGHNPGEAPYAIRGEWAFGDNDTYQVVGQLSTDPGRRLTSGQLLFGATLEVEGADAAGFFDGQMSPEGSLMVLNSTEQIGQVVLIRQAPQPTLDKLAGRWRLKGLMDAGGIVGGASQGVLSAVGGVLVLNAEGCVVRETTSILIAGQTVSPEENCASIGSDLNLSLNGDLRLVGRMMRGGDLMLLSLVNGDRTLVAMVVLVRIVERDDDGLEGKFGLNMLRAEGNLGEGLWGAITFEAPDIASETSHSTKGDREALGGGTFETSALGIFNGTLTAGDETFISRGQMLGDPVGIIVTQDNAGGAQSVSLGFWLRRRAP